jgi:Zn finger protein HypA/HybF involved in hydrogenase expression
VNAIPAIVECSDCGQQTQLGDHPLLNCPPCGGTRVTVTSGEEFLVRSVDVKD